MRDIDAAFEEARQDFLKSPMRYEVSPGSVQDVAIQLAAGEVIDEMSVLERIAEVERAFSLIECGSDFSGVFAQNLPAFEALKTLAKSALVARKRAVQDS